MQFFAMISQFILGLSFIVGIHELGHLLFAKLFGMRVNSYAIGFPPKLFRFKWGETEYSIGAIPLGGSVKIAGMIDESLDTTHTDTPPQPWEFRAKPTWQRLIVILGGIIANVVSGLIIYISLTFALGESYLPQTAVNKHGILPNAVGISLGLQEGDKILQVNGQTFTKFADALDPKNLLKKDAYYTVERDGEVLNIPIPADILEQLIDNKTQPPLITPRLPFEIGSIQPGSGATQAGLQVGDRITAVAGQKVAYFHELQRAVAAHAGERISIHYMRGGAIHQVDASVNAAGKLGFCPRILLNYQKQSYTFGQALVVGPQKAFEVIKINVLGLMKVITGKVSASKSLSGPIGIAQIFGKQFDWIHFWSITGFLSMILAFTNLLPIPALDGGHAVLIMIEMIIGRPLSSRLLENIQKVGLLILLFLIGYAIFNDLYKLF